MRERRQRHCSFCGEHEEEAGCLFQGPGLVAICDRCVWRAHNELRGAIQLYEPRKRLETKP